MARSLSKAEDTLQVQHTPDPSGPANGGKLSMSVGNYTTKSLSLYYYWNGKLSSRPVRIKSGERQSAKTYANARWRIVEAHHDSTAIEWVVDDAHGAVQQYDIREKSDADAEEDEEVDAEAEAERLARGQALIDELRGSTASADFVPSPSTDESLSSKTLSHGDAAAAAPSFSSLPNPSNYCFLNATTQCLRHTPHLAPNICAAAPYVTRAPFPFDTHTAFRPCSHPCPKCSSHTLWYGPIACDCHWQVGSDDSQARRRSAPRWLRRVAAAHGRRRRRLWRPDHRRGPQAPGLHRRLLLGAPA
jgi:hypothetical protein